MVPTIPVCIMWLLTNLLAPPGGSKTLGEILLLWQWLSPATLVPQHRCARHTQHMFILSPWWCLHGDVSMVMSPWWFLSHGDVSMVTLSPWWCNHALSLSLGGQHKICLLGNWLNSLINQKFSQFLILHFKSNIKNKAKGMIWFLLVSGFACAPQEKIWKKLEWHGKEIQAPWCYSYIRGRAGQGELSYTREIALGGFLLKLVG